MWSAERHRIPAILFLGLSLAVGACNVRPLYGPTPGGSTVSGEMASVALKPAAGRLGQIVRNELAFLLTGGSEQAALYDLKVDATATDSGVIVRSVGGEPQSTLVDVRVVYEMTRRGDPAVIFKGSVTRQATSEVTNQRFADDRAELDAETRAAKEAAEEIRLRLAAFFASGQTTATESSPDLPKEEDDDDDNRNLLTSPPISD